jgi:hypothetical protein
LTVVVAKTGEAPVAFRIAIDAGDPAYAPVTHRDGRPRNGPLDAGVYEFG